MPTINRKYVAQLQAEADHAAQVADNLSLRYITEWPSLTEDERMDTLEAMHQQASIRDRTRQQIAYMQGFTLTPAWED